MQANQDSYWIITIGKTTLALQANEVAFIAPIADLNSDKSTMSISGHDVPVYSFDDEFQLANCNPSRFRFCACLVSNQREMFALAIGAIKQETLGTKFVIYDLPLILTNPLFEKWVEIDNQSVLISRSDKIWHEIQCQLGVPATSSAILKVS